MNPSIKTTNLQKTFTLHNQNSTELKVLKNINFSILPGECVALTGKSGTGKSTFLRMLYGNYLPTAGTIEVLYQDTYYDLVHSLEHQIIYLRKHAIGYVSQFLVVIPRVSTFNIISNTLKQQGTLEDGSNEKISHLLETLNIKKNMWHLAPMTFSGGEQQRVNIAKTFIGDYPILFLDEPTSALDKENTEIVLDLIKSKLNKNVAIITIIHDATIRNQICTREFNLENFTEG